jgi:hypothetical protein
LRAEPVGWGQAESKKTLNQLGAGAAAGKQIAGPQTVANSSRQNAIKLSLGPRLDLFHQPEVFVITETRVSHPCRFVGILSE